MNERAPDMDQSLDTEATRRGWSIAETIEHLREHQETRDLIGGYEAAVRFAESIREHGGQALFVGGAVRDELLGQPPHDFDLEVHRLTAEQLEPLLAPFGKPDLTGKSFGTYKFLVDGTEIQIALPRRDSRTGDRHTDFDVSVMPDIGITEAARRRDFTIGAMSKDILTGDIYDPFHGAEDLEHHLLRMVDRTTFGDDALRVLRGARFSAAFDLQVEPETLATMRSMVERIGALPKERLRGEWLRLMDTEHPSRGIALLHEIGLLDRWHPELGKLWSTPQDPRHHPEGDAGTHTLMVADTAATLRRKLSDTQAQTEFMLAALTHDIGKPLVTTEDQDGIHSYGHEAAGVKPAETFLAQIGIPEAAHRRIGILVAEHMRPAQLYANRDQITDRALRKLARDVGPTNLRSLVLLSEADHRGRGPFTMPDGQKKFPDTSAYYAWWEEQMERLSLDVAPEPLLWGRDLVERQWKPGPMIGEALRLCEELAIQGQNREEVLRLIDETSSPEEAISALRQKITT